MLLQVEQMHKMTSISLKMVEVVILSVAQLVKQFFPCEKNFTGKTLFSLQGWVCCEHLFSSQLEISHVLNGTTPEIQLRK